jgi:hypothetical protein
MTLARILCVLMVAAGRKELLFEEKFENLEQWHAEGLKEGVTIAKPGTMRLACEGSKQGSVGAMAFCKKEFPDNIAIEYDLLVENHDGLLIIFIALKGVQGEDAITGVPARQGTFEDYVGPKASTRSYHVSVCRYDDRGKHTGVSNWRRNPGLNLMASGEDLCRETNKSYHVKIVKRGGTCRLEVDGRPGPDFVDPKKLPGAVPDGGKIGFRAIGSKAVFRISSFKVTTLE